MSNMTVSLPGVVLWCRAVAGEDLVQPGQRLLVQPHVQGPDGVVEVLLDTRADDRGRDGGLVQQPRQCDVTGLVTELVGEVLVGLDLRPPGLYRLRGPTLQPTPAVPLLAQ